MITHVHTQQRAHTITCVCVGGGGARRHKIHNAVRAPTPPDWTVTGTPGPGSAGSPRSLSVRVPENARAGDTMRIYHGVTGEVFSCAVPPGGEGQTLLVPI